MKKVRKRILSFAMALIMVVSAFTGIAVKETPKAKAASYSYACLGQVKGGTLITSAHRYSIIGNPYYKIYYSGKPYYTENHTTLIMDFDDSLIKVPFTSFDQIDDIHNGMIGTMSRKYAGLDNTLQRLSKYHTYNITRNGVSKTFKDTQSKWFIPSASMFGRMNDDTSSPQYFQKVVNTGNFWILSYKKDGRLAYGPSFFTSGDTDERYTGLLKSYLALPAIDVNDTVIVKKETNYAEDNSNNYRLAKAFNNSEFANRYMQYDGYNKLKTIYSYFSLDIAMDKIGELLDNANTDTLAWLFRADSTIQNRAKTYAQKGTLLDILKKTPQEAEAMLGNGLFPDSFTQSQIDFYMNNTTTWNTIQNFYNKGFDVKGMFTVFGHDIASKIITKLGAENAFTMFERTKSFWSNLSNDKAQSIYKKYFIDLSDNNTIEMVSRTSLSATEKYDFLNYSNPSTVNTLVSKFGVDSGLESLIKSVKTLDNLGLTDGEINTILSSTTVLRSENDMLIGTPKNDTKNVLYRYYGTSSSPEIPAYVDSIYKFAFKGNSTIRNVEIPFNVKNIDSGAFAINTNVINGSSGNKLRVTFRGFQANINRTSFDLTGTTEFVCYKGSEVANIVGNKVVELKTVVKGQDLTKDKPYITKISSSGEIEEFESGCFAGAKNLKSITFGKVKRIGSSAFRDTSLEGILILPSTVEYVGEDAFSLTNITKIVKGSKVECGTHIGRDGNPIPVVNAASFGLNPSEKILTTDKVEALGDVSTIEIGPYCEEIADDAFAGFVGKNVMYADLTNATELTKIGNRAFKNSALVGINFPNYIESIGVDAFANTGIKEVNIPNLTTMGEGAFANCKELTEVRIGGLKNIPNNAFNGDSKLSLISIEGATTIGENAFKDTAIKEYTIGKDVSSVGNGAFTGSQLETLTVENPNLSIIDAIDPTKTTIVTDEGSTAWEEADSKAKSISGAKTPRSTGKSIIEITFDNQEGTGGILWMKAKKNELPSNIPVDELPTVPLKRFIGYYTSPMGGDQFFNKHGEATRTVPRAMTLYARYEDDMITIKYDANDGTGTMSDTVVARSNAIDLKNNEFTREGYNFVGWGKAPNTSKANVMLKFNGTTPERKTESEFTVYAIWSKIAKVTVRFNGNGAESGSLSDITVDAGNIVAIPDIETVPYTRTDHTLKGWSLTPDGAYIINTNEIDTTDKEDGEVINLYAIWKKPNGLIAPPEDVLPEESNNKPKVDSNGLITLDDDTNSAEIPEYNEETNEYTFTEDSIPEIPKDKKFLGWSTDPDSTTAEYEIGKTYTFTEKVKLYPVFVDKGLVDYHIIIKKMVGMRANGKPEYEVIEKSAAAAEGKYVEVNATIYGKDGVTVKQKGDYDLEKGYVIDETESKLCGKANKDLILTVVMDKTKAKLIYDTNGHKEATNMPKEVEDYWGTTLNLELKELPTLDDYDFVGWSTTKNRTEETITKVTLDKEGTTVYAIWELKEDTAVHELPANATYTIVNQKLMQITWEDGKKEYIDFEDLGYILNANETTEIIFKSTIKDRYYRVNVEPQNNATVVKGITFSKKGSGAQVKSFDNSKSTVTIPSTVKLNGKTYKVTTIASKAFKGKKVKTVTLGKYVTNIGTSAFANCKKLKTVTFKTTKKVTIGKYAFKNSKVKTVKFGGKTAKVKSSAFKGTKATFKLKGSKKQKNTLKKALLKSGANKKSKFK